MASCHTHATCRRVRHLAIPTQPVGEYGILAIPTQPIGEYGVPPRNLLTTNHNAILLAEPLRHSRIAAALAERLNSVVAGEAVVQSTCSW